MPARVSSRCPILAQLSEALRQELVLHLNGDIVRRIPFFEGQDPGFVAYAVSLMRPEFTMKGDNLFVEGQIGNEMYFLIKGTVHIIGRRHDVAAGTPPAALPATLRARHAQAVQEELYAVVSEGNAFGEVRRRDG